MKRKRKRTVKGDYLRIGNLDLALTGLHIGTICYTGVLLVLASSSVVVACPFVTHQSTGRIAGDRFHISTRWTIRGE